MGSLPAKPEVRSVLVDSRNPKRVYAAGPAGVFRSDDAGETWQPSGTGLGTGAITTLAMHPSRPDTLYAVSAAGQIYRSDDGATSWQSLSP